MRQSHALLTFAHKFNLSLLRNNVKRANDVSLARARFPFSHSLIFCDEFVVPELCRQVFSLVNVQYSGQQVLVLCFATDGRLIEKASQTSNIPGPMDEKKFVYCECMTECLNRFQQNIAHRFFGAKPWSTSLVGEIAMTFKNFG